MTKARWASSDFKREGSSKKYPATMGKQAGRGGSGRRREWCVLGWICCVGTACWR